MNICYNTNDNFDFDSLSLGNPKSLQGGAYFSKVKMNDEPQLIFQTPKCKTKNGIIITGKKTYCDLMFTNDNDTFLKWLENIEKKIQELIFEKKDSWFHNDMDADDIDDFYNPAIRIYQGDKYLVRSSINQPRYIQRSTPLQIFDENENQLSADDIDNNKEIICILEVLGIKFTTTSIRTELCLRQIMALNNLPVFSKCLIQVQGEKREKKSNVPNVNNLIVNTDTMVEEDMEKKPKSVTFKNENNENANHSTDDDEKKAIDDAAALVKTDKMDDVSKNAEDLAKTDETESDSLKKQNINPTVDESTHNDESLSTESNISDDKDDTNEKIETVEMESDIKEESITNNSMETIDSIVIDDEKKKSENNPTKKESLEKNVLQEVNLAVSDKESIKLKKPDEIYYEIYYEAKRRAKAAKQRAIEAYLEAKRIKNTYLLSEIDSSDESDNESLTEIGQNS